MHSAEKETRGNIEKLNRDEAKEYVCVRDRESFQKGKTICYFCLLVENHEMFVILRPEFK